MSLNKKEFLEFVETIIKEKMSNRTEKEKDYVRMKCNQLIELFLELKSKNLIRNLSSNYSEIESKINYSLQNISDLNKFRANLSTLIGKRPPTGSTQIQLKDDLGNDLNFTMTQYVVFCGVTYSALCEFIKLILTMIIDFDAIPNANTQGIGAIKNTLPNVGIQKLDFFEHIDNKLRNSFFHMDFKITNEDGGRVYCDFDEKIYTSDYWKTLGNRSNEDDSQREYIKITDLIWQNILIDLSTFSLIVCVVYVMRKLFKL